MSGILHPYSARIWRAAPEARATRACPTPPASHTGSPTDRVRFPQSEFQSSSDVHCSHPVILSPPDRGRVLNVEIRHSMLPINACFIVDKTFGRNRHLHFQNTTTEQKDYRRA